MSTSAPEIQELPTIQERFVRVVCQPKEEVNDKGETITPERIFFSNEEDAQKYVNSGKGTYLYTQSFAYPKAQTDDGVVQICPSEKERVKLFNNGAAVKVQNRAKSLLTSKDEDGNYDFEPTEVYDLSEALAKESASRGASVYNKTIDLLTSGKLTPDQVKALKDMLLGMATE